MLGYPIVHPKGHHYLEDHLIDSKYSFSLMNSVDSTNIASTSNSSVSSTIILSKLLDNSVVGLVFGDSTGEWTGYLSMFLALQYVASFFQTTLLHLWYDSFYHQPCSQKFMNELYDFTWWYSLVEVAVIRNGNGISKFLKNFSLIFEISKLFYVHSLWYFVSLLFIIVVLGGGLWLKFLFFSSR